MPRETPYSSYQDDYAEEDKILDFPSTSGQDYATWKTFFCKATKHPAKANIAMLEWIIDTYTKLGDVIVDPMAGTGSTCIIAMRKGRHAIAGEYEWNYAFRFLLKNMHNARSIGSWEEIGEGFTIIGDSRHLSRSIPRALELMGLEDRVVSTTMFSPPYVGLHIKKGFRGEAEEEQWEKYLASTGRSLKAAKKNIERWQDYGDDPENIANMPQGSADAVITSPPYVGTLSPKSGGTDKDLEQLTKVLVKRGYNPKQIKKIMNGNASTTSVTMSKDARGYSLDEENIGNLPKGEVDGVITSPPYEGSLEHRGGNQALAHDKGIMPYTTDKDNIGNMTKDTYMQAMYDLYHDAIHYTKSGGLLILITKNFAKHKRPVDLAADTIKLAEKAGWLLMDRHYFRLPDKSFWIIQHTKKYAKRLYMEVNGVPGVKPKAPVSPCAEFIGTRVQGVRVWSEHDVIESGAVKRATYTRWVNRFDKWAKDNNTVFIKYALAFRDTNIAKIKIRESEIIHWFEQNGCTHPWADYEDILVFVKPTPQTIRLMKTVPILRKSLPEIWSDLEEREE